MSSPSTSSLQLHCLVGRPFYWQKIDGRPSPGVCFGRLTSLGTSVSEHQSRETHWHIATVTQCLVTCSPEPIICLVKRRPENFLPSAPGGFWEHPEAHAALSTACLGGSSTQFLAVQLTRVPQTSRSGIVELFTECEKVSRRARAREFPGRGTVG